MSRFDDVISSNIEKKAKVREERFFVEFQNLLNKYELSSTVKFEGLQCYRDEKNRHDESWRKNIFQIFIKTETNIFLQELNRLRDYL